MNGHPAYHSPYNKFEACSACVEEVSDDLHTTQYAIQVIQLALNLHILGALLG